MSDEDTLRHIFRDARPEVADEGFARELMQRIDRRRRRRRFVLGAAAAAGLTIAAPALLQAAQVLATNTTWVHVAGASVVNVVALCACALALWLVSVNAEI